MFSSSYSIDGGHRMKIVVQCSFLMVVILSRIIQINFDRFLWATFYRLRGLLSSLFFALLNHPLFWTFACYASSLDLEFPWTISLLDMISLPRFGVPSNPVRFVMSHWTDYYPFVGPLWLMAILQRVWMSAIAFFSDSVRVQPSSPGMWNYGRWLPIPIDTILRISPLQLNDNLHLHGSSRDDIWDIFSLVILKTDLKRKQ